MQTRQISLACTLFALCTLCALPAWAQQKVPLPSKAVPAATNSADKASATLPAPGKLTPIGDGSTVESADGKLIWMRCSLGQTFENGQCKGDPGKYTQRDATDEVKRINMTNGYAGSREWRLPTIEELQTLVYCEHGADERQQIIKLSATVSHQVPDACKGDNYYRPTIDPVLFPNAAKDWVWSATPDIDRVINMWALNFSSGSPASIGRVNNQTSARAVRNAR